MTTEQNPACGATGQGPLEIGRVSAASRARTILAVSHEAWCDAAGLSSGRLGSDHGSGRSLGLLDVGGVPYLVYAYGLEGMAEGSEISAVTSSDDLGVLQLTAWLGRPRPLVRDRAALQVFNEHRRCLQSDPGPLEEIVVQPFGLLRATVAAPLPDARAVEVSPDAVDGEEPDWLLVHGPSVAAHLESVHARELSELAGRCGWPGAAVCIRRLSATGVALDLLTADGVSTIVVPFEPPIRRTADLWPRLSAAVEDQPRSSDPEPEDRAAARRRARSAGWGAGRGGLRPADSPLTPDLGWPP